MPHLTLHYSANLKPPPASALLIELNRALSDLTGVALINFKSRAFACEAFAVGGGAPTDAFAHLDVRLLAGRTLEQKQQVADAALAILKNHFAEASRTLAAQVTVDCLDLDKDAYRKFAGTGGQ